MSDWDGSARNAGIKELGLGGLFRQALHNWKVKNTNDPELTAYNDYLMDTKDGDMMYGADIESDSSQHTRLMTGNPNAGYSGIPEFGSGEGTEMNPLAGDDFSVGVTGFRGGSTPKDITSYHNVSTYNEGPFKGLSFEDNQSHDRITGELDESQFITTQSGNRYDMKPRWWQYKYKPE